MEKLKTQIGISFDADFEENKWTFMLPDGYKVSAGAFAITPKEDFEQLQSINKDLIEALDEIIKTCNPDDVTPHKQYKGIDLGEYYVGGCGIPSGKSIHMAIKALNNAKNLNL